MTEEFLVRVFIVAMYMKIATRILMMNIMQLTEQIY